MSIHPTAVIDAKAEIDSGVEIGPYVVIEGQVKIKQGTRVMAHAYLTGWTEIGAGNEIHPGAILGATRPSVQWAKDLSEDRRSKYYSRVRADPPWYRARISDCCRQ